MILFENIKNYKMYKYSIIIAITFKQKDKETKYRNKMPILWQKEGHSLPKLIIKKNIIQRKPRDKINNKNRQVDKKEKAATKECTWWQKEGDITHLSHEHKKKGTLPSSLMNTKKDFWEFCVFI